jgi:hypothetical protein
MKPLFSQHFYAFMFAVMAMAFATVFFYSLSGSGPYLPVRISDLVASGWGVCTYALYCRNIGSANPPHIWYVYVSGMASGMSLFIHFIIATEITSTNFECISACIMWVNTMVVVSLVTIDEQPTKVKYLERVGHMWDPIRCIGHPPTCYIAHAVSTTSKLRDASNENTCLVTDEEWKRMCENGRAALTQGS